MTGLMLRRFTLMAATTRVRRADVVGTASGRNLAAIGSGTSPLQNQFTTPTSPGQARQYHLTAFIVSAAITCALAAPSAAQIDSRYRQPTATSRR